MPNSIVTCCFVKDETKTIEVERSQLVPRPSVYAVIIKNDHLLMIRGKSNQRLSLPGGGVSLDETFETALKRELWEETGLELVSAEYWKSFENFVYFEALNTYWHVYLEIYTVQVGNLDLALSDSNNPDDEGSPEWINLRTVKVEELQNIYKKIVQELKSELNLV
jgi:ADP-ribose pyrophosphatase YjhB (NUDIX family)